MPDLFHQWGGDLAVSPSGDLALATDAVLTQQRVLRRLLTNTGDYIWDLTYGAGLPTYVGKPINSDGIVSTIRSQLSLEPGVASEPPLQASINNLNEAYNVSGVDLNILYADSKTGTTQSLSFSVGG